jgi:hypothetical protein
MGSSEILVMAGVVVSYKGIYGQNGSVAKII